MEDVCGGEWKEGQRERDRRNWLIQGEENNNSNNINFFRNIKKY